MSPKAAQKEQLRVTDLILEIKHGGSATFGWIDRLASGDSMQGSGLCDVFCKDSSSDLIDEFYLKLFEKLDDFIKFLSLLLVYRRLANVAGDAAMFQLRTGLHHLLQELEVRLLDVQRCFGRVTDDAKRMVQTRAALGDTNTPKRELWIERLQRISERDFTSAYEKLIKSIQQLRFLSSSARQPALRKACSRSMNKLKELTESVEFSSRCLEAPPCC